MVWGIVATVLPEFLLLSSPFRSTSDRHLVGLRPSTPLSSLLTSICCPLLTSVSVTLLFFHQLELMSSSLLFCCFTKLWSSFSFPLSYSVPLYGDLVLVITNPNLSASFHPSLSLFSLPQQLSLFCLSLFPPADSSTTLYMPHHLLQGIIEHLGLWSLVCVQHDVTLLRTLFLPSSSSAITVNCSLIYFDGFPPVHYSFTRSFLRWLFEQNCAEGLASTSFLGTISVTKIGSS